MTEKLIQRHKTRMQQSTNYAEWKDAAQSLDSIEHKTLWKQTIASDIYNYEMLNDRLTTLRSYRNKALSAMLLWNKAVN